MRKNNALDDSLRKRGFMSVAEVAEATCLSRTAIYAALDNRELEGTSVGKRRYVLRSSLKDFLGHEAWASFMKQDGAQKRVG